MSTAALELGGSHVSAARVDVASAKVTDFRRTALAAGGTRAELLDVIRSAAKSVADGATHVGVATPGPFDYERGICTIRGVGKLDALFGVDLRDELSRVFPHAAPGPSASSTMRRHSSSARRLRGPHADAPARSG